MLCEYGCGKEAQFQLKNGKWCCSKSCNQCPVKREISRTTNLGRIRSEETKRRISESKKGSVPPNKGKLYHMSKEGANSIREAHQLTIKTIKKKYPLFSKIEEMRYNPDKPGEKEIQTHCKNHNCENSKERNGWFTPTYSQLYERVRQIEKNDNDHCYFYCCQKCKELCPLYYSHGGVIKRDSPYTNAEYNYWRKLCFNKQKEEHKKNFCEVCCIQKNLQVHHEKPVKTHPHLSLDIDNGIILCRSCHLKYGHKEECNTKNLAERKCGKNNGK
jgi:hypothetical protein